MLKKKVGELKRSGGQLDLEWNIPDFLSLTAEVEVDEVYESSEYSFCEGSWYIRMYPNGEKVNSSEGYIGIYVMRGESGPPVTATFSLFLKTKDGRKTLTDAVKHTFKVKSGRGPPKSLHRSQLMNFPSKYLPSGTLGIICSLKFHEDRTIKDIENLLSDLKGLSVSGNQSDLTVKVQGEDFRLHKAILEARAPNFALKNDVMKNTTAVLSLDDCEAGTFRSFLDYLYTGSTEGLPPETAFGLYDLAVKYQVLQLKSSCLFVLEQALAVDTFCDIVCFAEGQKEQDLVERATDFLSENTLAVISTKEWQILLKENPDQINELLMQALAKKEKNQKP